MSCCSHADRGSIHLHTFAFRTYMMALNMSEARLSMLHMPLHRASME